MKPRAWLARVAGLFGGRRRDQELADEFSSHLDLHIDELVRSGVPPAEARRRALAAAGGLTSATEAVRDRRGIPAVESVARDVRYGVRLLARSPAFALIAILSLAIGIGANTAVFAIIDALMLRTLPVPNPHELVQLVPGDRGTTWTYPQWIAIQDATRDRGDRFGRLMAWQNETLDLSTGGVVDPAQGLRVDTAFFDTLGVAPALGRSFGAGDEANPTVAVISDAFWQRHFGGAPDVVGRTLTLGPRVSFTVVGVMPREFLGPQIGSRFDIAVPLGASPMLDGRDRRGERTHRMLKVMARLAPGVSPDSATATLRGLQPALRAETMPDESASDQAQYLKDPIQVLDAAGGPFNFRAYYRQPLSALMALVALVLLAASANIANLLLARADSRRAEVGMRLALGASRARLVRQFLIESLLLATIGAALGLAMGFWASRVLVAELGTAGDPLMLEASLDWRVLFFTVAVATTVAMLFGTGPALSATRVDPQAAVQTRSRGVVGESRRRWASAVVPVQVALSLVLVAGAGLFVRTFLALAHRDLGFDAAHELVVDISARKSLKPPPARFADYDAIVERVRAVPGVRAAGLSAVTPMSNNEWDTVLENPPGQSLGHDARSVFKNLIGNGWFAAYGVPFVAGRDFDAADVVEHPHTVIVNEAAAKRLYPGTSPLGRTLRESGDDIAMTIVGVVKDVAYTSLTDAPPPTIYEPLGPGPTVKLSVLSASDEPASLTKAIVAAIGGVDPGLTLTARPLTWNMDELLIRERMLAHMSAFFGVLALLLAGLGIYGVIAYAVSRRTREIGIRMALGATRSGVVVEVMRRSVGLVAVGLLAGVLMAAWGSRYVASLLYGLAPGDPLTLALSALALVIVAAVASWLPSRRASRVDPALVLRQS